ncbi:hypothetical protein ACFTWS_38735 [Streptomyces sp. NPDC057027]|uniref:hypothetical protein n=1 Tax=Streptomyces sp. NPDC057027 TaxID=3346004 RepID=UPI0036272C43
MMRNGYTMVSEQAGPHEPAGYVAEAEQAGFDFSVISDHCSPSLTSQGRAPHAWSVLGVALQDTSRAARGSPGRGSCPSVRRRSPLGADDPDPVAAVGDSVRVPPLGGDDPAPRPP